jgi:hypothetical protein
MLLCQEYDLYISMSQSIGFAQKEDVADAKTEAVKACVRTLVEQVFVKNLMKPWNVSSQASVASAVGDINCNDVDVSTVQPALMAAATAYMKH